MCINISSELLVIIPIDILYRLSHHSVIAFMFMFIMSSCPVELPTSSKNDNQMGQSVYV